ncbi:2-amino-4-hydroxy-6-hydroxymethyldihydropteridine diphosphokinase [Occallatibacter savannae]|uniref:2-amino-4-hydroxy-6- hydroxymethyldihydropteridine diphosphokinase n=1 Tax=Occallatibacter savannae TaxID=1002691 RepID=UPI001EF70995|nr:2-amino-4-hydroxy-6-hydroxymethyldihydropteridine diphosphokinase [Occallatibacter savannae]
MPMHTAYVALGANLPSPAGPPAATLAAAVLRLRLLGNVREQSSLYTTEPVGYADQPRFLNAVVALETALEARRLLNELLDIEREFGRDRSAGIPNGPRTLDLDILLWNGLEVSEPGLELPHPRMAERAFVLVPLAEIAPHLLIPGSAKNIAELLQKLQTTRKGDVDAVVPIANEMWRIAARI